LVERQQQIVSAGEIKIKKTCKKINISSKISSDFFIFDVQCGDVADCQIYRLSRYLLFVCLFEFHQIKRIGLSDESGADDGWE